MKNTLGIHLVFMNKKLRKKTKQKIIIVMNEHYLYEYMLTLTTFATSYHM